MKISGSTKNPRKAYFKCLDCNNFVMWLGEEHLVNSRGFGRDEQEKGSVMHNEGGIRNELNVLKMKFEEVASFMKLMSFFNVLLFSFVVVAVIMKM